MSMTPSQLIRALRKLADILETAEGLVILTSNIKILHKEDLTSGWGIESRMVQKPDRPITLTVDIDAFLKSYTITELDGR